MKRLLGLPISIVLLAVSLPVTATAADDAGSLAAVTVVEGAGPASMLVNVPAPATVSAAMVDNADINADGGGRYIGVVLVSEAAEQRIGPTLIAGQLHPDTLCDQTGCPYGTATPVSSASLDWNETTNRLTLPAGVYRLHLVSEPDAGPVSITLRFGGLAGESRLSPAEASALRSVPMPPRVPLPESQSLYWNGAAHDMGSDMRGLMWSMVWQRHPLEPTGVYRYCVYRGVQPEDHPACPTAEIDMGINHSLIGYPLKAWLLLEGFGFPVQGNFGQKQWFAADQTDGLDGLALWLPFGDVDEPLAGVGGTFRASVFPALAIAGGSRLATPTTTTRCAPGPCSTHTGLFAPVPGDSR